MSDTIELRAEIGPIQYDPQLCSELTVYDMDEFKNGVDNGSFILDTGKNRVAISKWVTPKRTRSYPFERVYDTLQSKFRVALVPLVKDEGRDGDRDYLNWGTVSLLSLMNIFIIPAYYVDAEKNEDYENKITNQKMDFEYLSRKLREVESYQSDALHWNIEQMNNIEEVAKLCKKYYYEKIEPETGVELYDKSDLEKRISKMVDNVEEFKRESNERAENAQKAESSAQSQEGEIILNSKGKITLTNFLGGKYHFTVDEVIETQDKLYLLEKKNSRGTLPSMADIKDGLLKLVIYSNISKLYQDGEEVDFEVGIGMTGENLKESHPMTLNPNEELSNSYIERLNNVFFEAQTNGLIAFAAPSNISEYKQLRLLTN